MTTLEHVQALFSELGPATPDIAEIGQQGDEKWAIAYADELIVVVELAHAGRRLILAADAGRPSDESKNDVYETALTYNYLWKDNGGVHLAVSDEELTLIGVLDVADLTLAELQEALAAFGAKVRIWMQFTAGAGEAPTPTFEGPGLRV